MRIAPPGIAVVYAPTRLEGLRRRWGTARQAKFLLARAHVHELALRVGPDATASEKGRRKASRAPQAPQTMVQQQAEFADYEQEDMVYHDAVDQLEEDLQFGLPVKRVDRSFVPNFDFGNCEVVVVIGQDGLVANTAKYVGNLPIVAINPDPQRIDGILAPFTVGQARMIVRGVLDGKAKKRTVTLAAVELNDGQKMLAFNDFFVGAASHVSARYVLEVEGRIEPQSSSGVLVSTGAGSTGWLSSVFNMTGGVARFLGRDVSARPQLAWEDRRLMWTVREPFVSKRSSATLVTGWLDEGRELIVESLMPEGGVIFSDGIESDYLPFTSGAIARLRVSPQRANLVVG